MIISSYELIVNSINDFIKSNNYDKKNIFDALRWILSRSESSPNIYIIMYVIGKEQCIKNANFK
jgi:hypothetical protein